MVWIILIILFSGLLAWLLFGPVILYADTETGRYHLALPGVVRAGVVPSDEIFHFRVWIFFIPFRVHPFRSAGEKKKAADKDGETGKRGGLKPKPAKRKGLKLKPGSGSLRMMKELFRAIRIRRLDLDLDTDDFVLNAWLVPAFSMVNGENIRMRVNFEGKAYLLLDLRTRLGALLWILIKNRYRSMFNF